MCAPPPYAPSSVSTDTSAPFQIGIYSSADGTTPDQLLGSYAVGSVDSGQLTAGISHTIPIGPPAADVPGDYYLIAQDDQPAANTQVFDGGIFQGGDREHSRELVMPTAAQTN